MAKYCLEA
uniref:Uncharacterized protein n=1 Tax=Anguilla anguilla TaxID=7936 RepID=A0A0E9UDQ0_ANGAN